MITVNDQGYLKMPHFNSLLDAYQDDGFGNATWTMSETWGIVYDFVLEDLH